MGRPLNKKFFGNRNIGTTGTGDDGIGGEGIASINWSTLGAFIGNSNVNPITFPALPAPTLPGGVQATWTAQYEVESVTTGAGKALLALNDTFTIASIPGLIAKVVDISGLNALFSVTVAGASRGAALALADIPKDTLTVTMTQSGGTGTAGTFTTDIYFQIKASTVTITEKGSGYTGAETFTFTKPGTTVGNVPAGTIVLTTSTGAPGTTTNQENAIAISAFVPGGSSAVAGDIVKQTASRAYRVKTVQGTGRCDLVAAAPTAGQMTMTAVDSAGGTYYVTKLTARRALIIKGDRTGTQFTTGTAGITVPWSYDPAVLNQTVRILNA